MTESKPESPKPKPKSPKRVRTPEQIAKVVALAEAFLAEPDNAAKRKKFSESVISESTVVGKDGVPRNTYAIPAGRPTADIVVSAKRWVETRGVSMRWPKAHLA